MTIPPKRKPKIDSHIPAPTGNTYDQLISDPIHWFSDWHKGDALRSGAVVYTIWDREGSFIYVDMSGRNFTGGAEGNGKPGPLGGSIATQAGDGVAISSAFMSLIGSFSQPSTTASQT